MQSRKQIKSSTEELINDSIQNLNQNKTDELNQPNLISQLSTRTDDESINDLNIIPETSYSSSEDEEFFFDAEDEDSFNTITQKSSSSTLCIEQKLNKTKLGSGFNNSNSINNKLKTLNNNNNLVMNNNKDYDACYENDNEDDLGSLEGQGSVITHILSQLKIGMDLTKIVLPTFILERRSLLEMYADFFAHPDLFCSIPDFETPEERFIQTVKWYLSAFHAGRKSSVAKKPYNPILGEMFKCYWNLPKKEVCFFFVCIFFSHPFLVFSNLSKFSTPVSFSLTSKSPH